MFKIFKERQGEMLECSWMRIVKNNISTALLIILPLYVLKERVYDVGADKVLEYHWCLPYIHIRFQKDNCIEIRWGMFPYKPFKI